MKPLITSKFRATTIPKTFIINAIVIAIIATVGIETKSFMNRKITKTNSDNYELSEVSKAFITLGSTFLAGLITYTIMYILFNFGGGMLAPNKLV